MKTEGVNGMAVTLSGTDLEEWKAWQAGKKERDERRGDFWLTEEGRRVIHETWNEENYNDGNCVLPLLGALEEAEAKIRHLEELNKKLCEENSKLNNTAVLEVRNSLSLEDDLRAQTQRIEDLRRNNEQILKQSQFDLTRINDLSKEVAKLLAENDQLKTRLCAVAEQEPIREFTVNLREVRELFRDSTIKLMVAEVYTALRAGRHWDGENPFSVYTAELWNEAYQEAMQGWGIINIINKEAGVG